MACSTVALSRGDQILPLETRVGDEWATGAEFRPRALDPRDRSVLSSSAPAAAFLPGIIFHLRDLPQGRSARLREVCRTRCGDRCDLRHLDPHFIIGTCRSFRIDRFVAAPSSLCLCPLATPSLSTAVVIAPWCLRHVTRSTRCPGRQTTVSRTPPCRLRHLSTNARRIVFQFVAPSLRWRFAALWTARNGQPCSTQLPFVHLLLVTGGVHTRLSISARNLFSSPSRSPLFFWQRPTYSTNSAAPPMFQSTIPVVGPTTVITICTSRKSHTADHSTTHTQRRMRELPVLGRAADSTKSLLA